MHILQVDWRLPFLSLTSYLPFSDSNTKKIICLWMDEYRYILVMSFKCSIIWSLPRRWVQCLHSVSSRGLGIPVKVWIKLDQPMELL